MVQKYTLFIIKQEKATKKTKMKTKTKTKTKMKTITITKTKTKTITITITKTKTFRPSPTSLRPTSCNPSANRDNCRQGLSDFFMSARAQRGHRRNLREGFAFLARTALISARTEINVNANGDNFCKNAVNFSPLSCNLKPCA